MEKSSGFNEWFFSDSETNHRHSEFSEHSRMWHKPKSKDRSKRETRRLPRPKLDQRLQPTRAWQSTEELRLRTRARSNLDSRHASQNLRSPGRNYRVIRDPSYKADSRLTKNHPSAKHSQSASTPETVAKIARSSGENNLYSNRKSTEKTPRNVHLPHPFAYMKPSMGIRPPLATPSASD